MKPQTPLALVTLSIASATGKASAQFVERRHASSSHSRRDRVSHAPTPLAMRDGLVHHVANDLVDSGSDSSSSSKSPIAKTPSAHRAASSSSAKAPASSPSSKSTTASKESTEAKSSDSSSDSSFKPVKGIVSGLGEVANGTAKVVHGLGKAVESVPVVGPVVASLPVLKPVLTSGDHSSGGGGGGNGGGDNGGGGNGGGNGGNSGNGGNGGAGGPNPPGSNGQGNNGTYSGQRPPFNPSLSSPGIANPKAIGIATGTAGAGGTIGTVGASTGANGAALDGGAATDAGASSQSGDGTTGTTPAFGSTGSGSVGDSGSLPGSSSSGANGSSSGSNSAKIAAPIAVILVVLIAAIVFLIVRRRRRHKAAVAASAGTLGATGRARTFNRNYKRGMTFGAGLVGAGKYQDRIDGDRVSRSSEDSWVPGQLQSRQSNMQFNGPAYHDFMTEVPHSPITPVAPAAAVYPFSSFGNANINPFSDGGHSNEAASSTHTFTTTTAPTLSEAPLSHNHEQNPSRVSVVSASGMSLGGLSSAISHGHGYVTASEQSHHTNSVLVDDDAASIDFSMIHTRYLALDTLQLASAGNTNNLDRLTVAAHEGRHAHTPNLGDPSQVLYVGNGSEMQHGQRGYRSSLAVRNSNNPFDDGYEISPSIHVSSHDHHSMEADQEDNASYSVHSHRPSSCSH
ncbi:hypothetical protein K437DRAFT_57528 [Tilletiaria anomala UBC 951]|uniref:Uncharacterized protein n=1 Tax=Tilletiaria anomala (strain ATCC 24038 / CBS 436.72 / UBC 951) TaxID=1037660 RepID=A0A066V7N0_TILAU|nr:uncharacterized protein K437DRAFT_57528 [Tilletiaria anomala UBC 951]KDN36283.1 hypothetical protein K437DRAFT_57528 [Tilletiaria anomala UBC 951]